jgi:hypothetical protein
MLNVGVTCHSCVKPASAPCARLTRGRKSLILEGRLSRVQLVMGAALSWHRGGGQADGNGVQQQRQYVGGV